MTFVKMGSPQHISLSELTDTIEATLKKQMQNHYWVIAEVSDCSVNMRGHCYLELIEKPDDSDEIVSKMRATIWAQTYRLVSAYFKASTGSDLQAGMKVLLKVSVEFHAVYGMSLNISDIDPSYTIGEDEKQRREILRQLEEEGILEMNQELELSEVPQKIAIISSPQAAGYEDFMNQLHDNNYGIVFYTKLFPASMQGLEVESTIVSALDKIYVHEEVFDTVVIIRGGGAKTDLRWFDNYNIAANIAQFPLPIISGIGHDKDESIVDLVSHTALKTPTAVAEFLVSRATNVLATIQGLEEQIEHKSLQYLQGIQTEVQSLSKDLSLLSKEKFHKEYLHIQDLSQSVVELSYRITESEKYKLKSYTQQIQSDFKRSIQSQEEKLTAFSKDLQYSSKSRLEKLSQTLQLLELKISASNPQEVLKKGYSIVTDNQGKVVHDAKKLKQGDELNLRLKKGAVKTIVKK